MAAAREEQDRADKEQIERERPRQAKELRKSARKTKRREEWYENPNNSGLYESTDSGAEPSEGETTGDSDGSGRHGD